MGRKKSVMVGQRNFGASRSNPALLRVSNFNTDNPQSTSRYVSLAEHTTRLILALTMEMLYPTAHAARILLVTAHYDRFV